MSGVPPENRRVSILESSAISSKMISGPVIADGTRAAARAICWAKTDGRACPAGIVSERVPDTGTQISEHISASS